MEEIFVGVSGINAADNPGPGIGVARSLKADSGLNVKIVGLAYDAMEPGIYLDRHIDRSFIMPYPTVSFESYFGRLQYIKESYGLDFVIPNLDAELPLYAKYAKELKNAGIGTFIPTLDEFKVRGKDRLSDVAEKIGVKVPLTTVVSSFDEFRKALNETGYPLMVKGAMYKAYRAYTEQEAYHHYHQIVAEWGYPVIVQQVVKGEEMNVIGLGDGEGNSLGVVGIKKLTITPLGKIWTGVTVKHEGALDATEQFIKKYKWKGGFELECIVDDGDIYLIEINPRFPAWLYFATGVGCNLPANLLRKALGKTVIPYKGYDAGKLFIRYTEEIITDMEKFQNINMKGEC